MKELLFLNRHVALLGLECIYRNDKPVGFLRRGDFAFALGKSIGYGYVTNPAGENITNDFLKSGTYSIESLGNLYPASIHIKPPFDPKNKRVKGIYEDPLPIHLQ